MNQGNFKAIQLKVLHSRGSTKADKSWSKKYLPLHVNEVRLPTKINLRTSENMVALLS